MATRSNALSELTRFWLQARHGCLVDEGTPVAVPFGLSDIDLVAIRADLQSFSLPDGTRVGPRVIIETKDEHDFDPKGRNFGKCLRKDIEKLGDNGFIPRNPKSKVYFSMLREAHFEKAVEFFGSVEFDRLFVTHALDTTIRKSLAQVLAPRRIYWLTIDELLADLECWYLQHPRKSGLRNNMIGDLWHLLVGFCEYRSSVGRKG